MAALRDRGTRQDTWIITLEVAGNSWGIWDKKTGGALDSEEYNYNPGAMKPPIALGGKKTTENITLQRLYDLEDDHDRVDYLTKGRGRYGVKVAFRPMDPETGEAYGKSFVYRGKLKRVSPPDIDSESNSAAMLEVECSITGDPVVV